MRQIGLVGSFRLAKKFNYFRLELCFEFAGVIVAQGLMFGGIRLDLCSVQANGAQFQDPRLPGNQQDLDEQRFELRQKPLPEDSDGVMIRMSIGSDKSEGYRIISTPLQFSAREHPGGISVEQERQSAWG